MASKQSSILEFVQRVFQDVAVRDDFLKDPDRVLAEAALDEEDKRTLKGLSANMSLGKLPSLKDGKTWW